MLDYQQPEAMCTQRAETASLFSPFALRGVTLRNRIMVSPMCQYSSVDGLANDWHLVHLGSRAVGGAAIVMMEATAVTADGRISPQDMGIWGDQHIEPLARIARFVTAQGAVPSIQLAHAGRKASTYRPWDGRGAVPTNEGGWQPVAPSPLRFSDDYALPRELSEREIVGLVEAFAAAAGRAVQAGFQMIEIHAAHGYLIHEFLSPLSNKRSDKYGGDFAGRTRFLREIVASVRRIIPTEMPLGVRLSCTEWVEGGWDGDDSVTLARLLREDGVDIIDCSSGGNVPQADIPIGPNYQVPYAARIRRETGMPTIAVGLITEPVQADAIVREGEADVVACAREDLRDPYWPLHAAHALGVDVAWSPQYERAKPR